MNAVQNNLFKSIRLNFFAKELPIFICKSLFDDDVTTIYFYTASASSSALLRVPVL